MPVIHATTFTNTVNKRRNESNCLHLCLNPIAVSPLSKYPTTIVVPEKHIQPSEAPRIHFFESFDPSPHQKVQTKHVKRKLACS